MGMEHRRKPRRPLERQGPEYVGFAIMGCLVQLREHPEKEFEVGISPYAIMRKVRRLNTQKQDRVEEILELFEKNGLVRSRSAQRARYYEITDKGMEWYKRIAKAFYEIFLGLYKEPES
jgi:predicted transcriptional regulator